MNTNEAIEYIKMIECVISDLKEMKNESYMSKMDNIIALLKWGKAYKDMWWELNQIFLDELEKEGEEVETSIEYYGLLMSRVWRKHFLAMYPRLKEASHAKG